MACYTPVAVDVLGKHAGLAKDEVIPSELIKLLATDVQSVVRGPDFALQRLDEKTSDDGDDSDEDVLLGRIYARWAMTLGAYRAGDM